MYSLNTIKRKLLNPNVKIMAAPVGVILILAIASYYVINAGYLKIAGRLKELNDIKSTQSILENKVETLRQIQQGLLDRADIALVVMPDVNPVMFTVSQVKRFLGQHGNLSLIEVRSTDSDEDLNRSVLVFSGEFENIESIFAFLKDLKDVAPINSVNVVDIKREQGLWIADVEVILYWSALPQKLPPLTTPLVELTNEEKETLFSLSNYYLPQFSELDPGGPTDRRNPFN